MESNSLVRVFTSEEKQKILNFTLDNVAAGALKGLFIGGALRMVTKNKVLGLFAFSYMVGMSLRESNDYILTTCKI